MIKINITSNDIDQQPVPHDIISWEDHYDWGIPVQVS